MSNLQDLCSFYSQDLFTDVTLTLMDEYFNTIKINVHRIMLSAASDYFKKLFIDNKNTNYFLSLIRNNVNYKINVPDVYVFRDLIISFYGGKEKFEYYPEWRYLLEMVRCKNFLNLNFDTEINQITKLPEVPSDGLELLLKVAEIIRNNEQILTIIIKLIYQNLTLDFDYGSLPNYILEEIFKLVTEDSIYHVVVNCNLILEMNSLGKIINSANLTDENEIQFIKFCQNKKIFIAIDKNQIISLYKINGTLIKKLDKIVSERENLENNKRRKIDPSSIESSKILGFDCDPDGKYIVYFDNHNVITVLDIEIDTIQQIKYHSTTITTIAVSENGKIFAIGKKSGHIKILNLEEMKEIEKFNQPFFTPVLKICFCNDKLISMSNKKIVVWSLSESKILNTFSFNEFIFDMVVYNNYQTMAIILSHFSVGKYCLENYQSLEHTNHADEFHHCLASLPRSDSYPLIGMDKCFIDGFHKDSSFPSCGNYVHLEGRPIYNLCCGSYHDHKLGEKIKELLEDENKS